MSANNKLQLYTQYAHNDKTITRVYRACPECKHDIAKQLLIGTDEKVVFICDSCHAKFTLA
jgi:transposase-like protein